MFLYFLIFFSFLFFCLSFLEFDPIKSCIMMCFGVVCASCYISLGVHVWYSYFIILLFLSGIFSLLTYFCSLSYVFSCYNYFYFFCFFILMFIAVYFFFDYDYFSFFLDFNFISIYYDFSYYYVFWIIFVLFLLLIMVSFNFGTGCYMRGF